MQRTPTIVALVVLLSAGCADASGGLVEFRDTFERDNLNWPTGSDSHVDLFVKDGEYRIRLRGCGEPVCMSSPEIIRTLFGRSFPHAVAEASLEQLEPAEGAVRFGVGCWTEREGLLMVVDPEGAAGLLMASNIAPPRLLYGPVPTTPVPIGDSWVLRIECLGGDDTQVMGWVNGDHIVTIAVDGVEEDFEAIGLWAAASHDLDLAIDEVVYAVGESERSPSDSATVEQVSSAGCASLVSAWLPATQAFLDGMAAWESTEEMFDAPDSTLTPVFRETVIDWSLASEEARWWGCIDVMSEQAHGLIASNPAAEEFKRWLTGQPITGHTDDESPALTRVTHEESTFGGPGYQRMSSVAVGGPGLVTVGVDRTYPAVWTSADGNSWTRISIPTEWARMDAVTPFGTGLVAVGTVATGGEGMDAAVWTSPDGTTWTRVPDRRSVFGGPGDQEMWAVAAGPSGLVAVGIEDMSGDLNVAVWTSPDSVAWSRVDDPGLFNLFGNQAVIEVVAGGPGWVAVGHDDAGGDRDAAVWTSPDGQTWSRVAHDESIFGGPQGQGMRSVMADGHGLVAVGYDGPEGDSDAAVWTSVDGSSWTRNQDSSFVAPGHQEMSAITMYDGKLVAIGLDASRTGFDVALWISSDGTTWERRQLEATSTGGGSQFAEALTRFGSRLIIVGYSEIAGDSDAAVWQFEE